jgi:phasin family protein
MQSFTDKPALRSHLDSQVDLINEFGQKVLDTLLQVSEINLKLARQTGEASTYASREIINARDPAQFSQTVMQQLQLGAERLRNYQQQLLSALAGAQADLTHAAENRMPEAGRRATAAADEMVRQASSAVNVPVTGPGGTAPNGPAPATPPSGNGSAAGQQTH